MFKLGLTEMSVVLRVSDWQGEAFCIGAALQSFVKALAADSSRSDPKTVVLKYDVAYAHLVGMLLEQGGFHCLSD